MNPKIDSKSPSFLKVLIAIIKIIFYPALALQWCALYQKQKKYWAVIAFGSYFVIGLTILTFLTHEIVRIGIDQNALQSVAFTSLLYIFVGWRNFLLGTNLKDERYREERRC